MKLKHLTRIAATIVALVIAPPASRAQDAETSKRLGDFDAWMEKTLSEWNAPGVGVGIVRGDRLVFAKGYGYRDYGKKLPFTPKTLMPIASNSKLFTAVAAGMLVQEGKLTWDAPVRQSVPAIEFATDDLNRSVTLRDMLSHRTGITRHDLLWYKSPFSRAELFARVKYLEPKVPVRQSFLYNNLMFAAVGQMIEIQTGKSWEDFVRQRIFRPLKMDRTVYTIAEMVASDDHGVPFTEHRDDNELYRIPYYEDTVGMAPAGAIISNIEETSHWLVALMNEGRFEESQVLPASVLAQTLMPAIALGNPLGEARGFWEILNATSGWDATPPPTAGNC